MKRTIYMVMSALAAGILVWIPGICIHFASGYKFGPVEVLLILISMPVSTYFIRRMLLKKTDRVWLVSLIMLLGVWLSGPLCMMVAGSTSGGGFTQPKSWSDLLSMTFIFPLATWCMSAYDGSLGGLVLTTIVLLIKPGKSATRVLHKLSD